MSAFLLLAFSVACAFLILDKLRYKTGIYHYQFLSAAVFLGFVGLQLTGLINKPNITQAGLNKTILMALLCVIMVYVGAKVGSKPFQSLNWSFNVTRLMKASLILSLIGAIFYYLISRLPEDVRVESMPTGVIVAYGFFAQMMTYGFAIAVLVYATYASRLALVVMLFDLSFYVDRILVGARRGEAAVIIAIFALALLFRRGWVVPRTIAVSFMIFATFFIYSTGDYRERSKDESLVDLIGAINYGDNIKSTLANGGPEMELAVHHIEAVDRRMTFDFGAFYWNAIVFNYVPAQLVGYEFKELIRIQTENAAIKEFGYGGMTGSTSTGLTDAFQSFWYFGAFVFFVISYILSRIYASALKGSVGMQLIYMLMLINGLHTITHNTAWFTSPWVHLFMFLLPALVYARIRTPQ